VVVVQVERLRALVVLMQVVADPLKFQVVESQNLPPLVEEVVPTVQMQVCWVDQVVVVD
jgi:hypothetical protein